MKHEKGSPLLCGVLLAFLFSFSCVFCMATAFDLLTDGLADLRQLALWCALISLLCGISYSIRFGGIVLFAALVLYAAYLWFYGTLELSIEALCNTISTFYNEGYRWGILRWSGTDLQAVGRTMALQVIGTFVAMAAAWTVCRKRPTVWAILVGLLPLVSCTILTTTVPAKAALFLWLLAVVLLLLTQAARRRNALEGNKLTLISALPVILALALLFRLIPQEDYTGDVRAKSLLNEVESLFSGSGATGSDANDDVDLRRVGRMIQRLTPVMDVTAPTSGTYYLRGRAYDVYTGTEWKDSGTVSAFLPWPTGGTYRGEVTIETKKELAVFYLPYYADSMQEQQIGNVLQNDGKERVYSFACYEDGIGPVAVSYIPDESEFAPMTALPEATRQWAEEKVEEILPGHEVLSPAETAAGLCTYLKSYARYDLSTPRMDSDYTDFAQWFLSEADSGYCVHYATAATVLLRAAGVPARYVTGFTVEAVAGETVTVPEKNAHAWVEYWTVADGWKILEPTPAAQEESSAQTTTAPTDETQAEATTASAETEETTLPAENNGNQDESVEETEKAGIDLTALFRVLRWFAFAALLMGLIVGQWKFRVFLRRRARQYGTPNDRALRCWRQVKLYARVLGEKPEPALRGLAQKAKFSQYVLTEEELQQFEQYFSRAVAALEQKTLLLRLIYRLVLALF